MKRLVYTIVLPDEVDLLEVTKNIHKTYFGDEGYIQNDTLLDISKDHNEVNVFHDLESASAISNCKFLGGFIPLENIIKNTKQLSNDDWNHIFLKVFDEEES